MTTQSAMTELQSMPLDDLRREVRGKREALAKLRLGVEMQKEKDTAKYQREKKMLARMLMVLGEKTGKTLRQSSGQAPKMQKKLKTDASVSSSSSVSSLSSPKALSKPKKSTTLSRRTS